VCPCQTMVPFYRNHVFGQIKPSTRDRIDLGLALKDTKVPKRLIDTGGFAKKDRITHRIEINSVNDIDDEVKRWLKKAYDMDAEARRGKPPAKRTA
jgi:predicted GTPase